MASKQRCTCLHPRRVVYATLQKPGFFTIFLCYACYTAVRQLLKEGKRGF